MGWRVEDWVLLSALACIYLLAFVVRLVSVVRYEALIHEYDPHFNYRATQHLVTHGTLDFANWFDPDAWYPLGRIVGGTVYPGLMLTASLVHKAAMAVMGEAVDIRLICVFLAPWFASNSAIAAYFLAKETSGGSKGAGLVAALLFAVVPGYVQRSVAGSFDNEGVSIFALLLTFLYFARALRTGRLSDVLGCCLAYYYMVNAWGGYVFIANLLPAVVGVLTLMGRAGPRLFVVYSVWCVVGALLAAQVHFVGFNAFSTGEHMASFAALFFLAGALAGAALRARLGAAAFYQLLARAAATASAALTLLVVAVAASGYVAPWTARFWTLLDPAYAKRNIPLIASVAEHQPMTWASFVFDLHCTAACVPAGVLYAFFSPTFGPKPAAASPAPPQPATAAGGDAERERAEAAEAAGAGSGGDAGVFMGVYAVFATYFTSVMVRLVLVLSPAACVVAGGVLSRTLATALSPLRGSGATARGKGAREAAGGATRLLRAFRVVVAVAVVAAVAAFVSHGVHCAEEMYSSPSIVIATGRPGVFLDDYREAYGWLRHNTAPNAKIMSWWDYGYQLTELARRPTLVDNNTWNNTHIARVGSAMASPEAVAHRTMRELDVDYVLVVFGGLVGYSSDDIMKFLWMVRIGGTLVHSIKEADYHTANGDYRVDDAAPKAMRDSMMYRLSYHRFWDVPADANSRGMDYVRKQRPLQNITLTHVTEVFTTENWMLRIYRVNPDANHRAGVQPPTPMPAPKRHTQYQ